MYALGKWCTVPDGKDGRARTNERRGAGRFSLAEARVERQRSRDMVKLGRHPLNAKKAGQQARAHSSANTFGAVTREFVEKRGGHWSDKHSARFESFMDRDVHPDIGALPIRDVTATAVLAVLRKVEDRGATDVAALGRGFIGQVFRYAVATGRCDSDPTLAMRGALKAHTKQHHAPLERADMPAFFSTLAAALLNRPTGIAVRLLAYLFVRPGELGGGSLGRVQP